MGRGRERTGRGFLTDPGAATVRKDFLRCLQRNPQTEEGFYLSVRWDWKRQQKVISREARQKKGGDGGGAVERGKKHTERGETEVDVGELAEFLLDPGCEVHWRERTTQSGKKNPKTTTTTQNNSKTQTRRRAATPLSHLFIL